MATADCAVAAKPEGPAVTTELFAILTWNIAGAKFLQLPQCERCSFRRRLNAGLGQLVTAYKPLLVCLQEDVQYQQPSQALPEDMIIPPAGYRHYLLPIVDSRRFSSCRKWARIMSGNNWQRDSTFAIGNGMLIRNDIAIHPVFDLSDGSGPKALGEQAFIERVRFDRGLFFGDRDTEPREALVAHLIMSGRKVTDASAPESLPLDVFVVAYHATTLARERCGIPAVDAEASEIRMRQVRLIFDGIVSRYNNWRQCGYPESDELCQACGGKNLTRREPVWIICGDLNCGPHSKEYAYIKQMDFVDLVPDKGSGTKAKGLGNPASLTVDYIFAGPKSIAFGEGLEQMAKNRGKVASDLRVSDHNAVCGWIPADCRITTE